MEELHTGVHLFQPPQYHVRDVGWFPSLDEALANSPSEPSIDVGALLGVMSNSFACGDATMVCEIRRQPWLSRLIDQEIVYETIPPHDYIFRDCSEAAAGLLERLKREIELACQGSSRVVLLLSGGLDSRIVAGVTCMLASEGRLSASISSVTWGKEDSRDVHYGKAVATRLGIAWEHIPMDAEHFLANVETMGAEMAALSYPHHLHRMTWFSQCSADTLVLAGSYGDSVGRAEYCGKHVLELSALSAFDEFGLLTPHAAAQGVHAMNSELRALRERGGGGLPEFVHCEHEQQAHYMRGGLGQVMNIINRYCQLYQAFTSPHVYTYMWALHPACRNDEIYANMLEMLPAEIARLPWARTNRALRGKTIGADERLSRNFHDYYDWSRNIVRPAYKHLMEPEWFADTGLFRLGGIERLDLDFKSSSGGVHLDEIWTYLISFRMFVESMQAAGKRVRFLDRETAYPPARIQPRNPTLVQSLVRRSRVLERLLRALRARYRARRRRMLMKWAVKKFCPREKT